MAERSGAYEAYCAGLFHGEGCFTVELEQLRLRVELEMQDRRAIEALHARLGGRLTTPRQQRGGTRVVWRILFQDTEDIRQLCRRLLPWVEGNKAQQIRDLLALAETLQLLRARRRAEHRRSFTAREREQVRRLGRAVRNQAGGGGPKAWRKRWNTDESLRGTRSSAARRSSGS